MSQVELDQLLNGIAGLDTAELEKFAQQVNLLLARRKVPSFPQPEAELLQRINQGLPAATQHRYNELRAKLQAQTLSPAEHQELLALTDTIEQADAERLQHLIELAQLRQVPLADLMQQLGIHPPTIHA